MKQNTIGQLIEFLKAYHPDTPCAWSLWMPDDVLQYCDGHYDNNGGNPTPRQIESILDTFNQDEDASEGLTWQGLGQIIHNEMSDNDPLNDLIDASKNFPLNEDHWSYRYFHKRQTAPPLPNPENGDGTSEEAAQPQKGG